MIDLNLAKFFYRGRFSKWPPKVTTISAPEARRDLILVSIPFFSGSRNPKSTTSLDFNRMGGSHLEFQKNNKWPP